MAEKRTYTVPLRRKFQRTERHQRAKKAVTELRIFLKKHMKSETVKIGPALNRYLWSHGIRKPPSRVEIVTEKNDEGVVYAELSGTPLPSEALAEPTEETKKAPAKKAPEPAAEQSE